LQNIHIIGRRLKACHSEGSHYLIEVELKCELSPQLLEKVRQKIQGMQFRGTAYNHDIYYDTPTWDLLRRAVFVRVRNNQKIEFKFNEDASQEHKLAFERVFPLQTSPSELDKLNSLFAYFLPTWQSATSFEDALTKNNLTQLVTVNNTREAYANEYIDLSIDHVKGLGDFLEVETQCEEDGDTIQAQARLQAFVADLHVQHIKVGYVELWLYKHNPEAYQAGRYHL
jgi:adenylate cyclase class IV